MPLRVAFQMDAPASLNFHTDSTLLLGLEAQARGHEVWHYTPEQLSWNEGEITARATRTQFFADPKHFFELGESKTLHLRDMDVVWLRQDPPFDMSYLTTTYILEQLPNKTLVVNNPASVRNRPEKLFPTLLREFMPPTLISVDIQEITAFYAKHKDIVIKPLYGYGGRAVWRLREHDGNFQVLMEALFTGRKEPVMAQKFLPEVKTGDRRIILIDGEIGGVMARIPAEGEIRANFRVGGQAAKAELTPRQKDICAALRPELKKLGLVFVGLDVIGDWLTEINITSPTGLAAMNRLYGLKLEANIWDAVEAKIQTR